jgi:hypothetical protein
MRCATAMADQVAALIRYLYAQPDPLAPDRMISAYRQALGNDAPLKEVFSEIYSDAIFRTQVTQFAARQTARGRAACMYEFAQPLKQLGHGTPHTFYYPGRRHMAASLRVFVDLAHEIVFRNRAKAS